MKRATVHVPLPHQAYRITIGAGLGAELVEFIRTSTPRSRCFVVTDENVDSLHGAALRHTLGAELCGWWAAPPGESSKSLGMAEKIFERLASARVERDDLLIAFGGGVVGDLTGFVAATWMRGVRFLQMPTTLEAAIDASIGGKTGLNLAAGKNLVGAFHQPVAVVIDTDFLGTLAPRDFAAGLAESVKHAAIGSEEFFAWHESAIERLSIDAGTLSELIVRNCETKAGFVVRDEREQGVRAFLNYGHTIGHAIEALLGYELRHGECVALGIRVENQIAVSRALLSEDQAARISSLLKRCGLPTSLPRSFDPAALLEATRADKKVRRGMARYALIEEIGRPVLVGDVSDAQVLSALSIVQSA